MPGARPRAAGRGGQRCCGSSCSSGGSRGSGRGVGRPEQPRAEASCRADDRLGNLVRQLQPVHAQPLHRGARSGAGGLGVVAGAHLVFSVPAPDPACTARTARPRAPRAARSSAARNPASGVRPPPRRQRRGYGPRSGCPAGRCWRGEICLRCSSSLTTPPSAKLGRVAYVVADGWPG